MVNKLQSVHMPNTFQCIRECWRGKFWQMAHNHSFFSAKNFGDWLTISANFFLCQKFQVYGTSKHWISQIKMM